MREYVSAAREILNAQIIIYVQAPVSKKKIDITYVN